MTDTITIGLLSEIFNLLSLSLSKFKRKPIVSDSDSGLKKQSYASENLEYS